MEHILKFNGSSTIRVITFRGVSREAAYIRFLERLCFDMGIVNMNPLVLLYLSDLYHTEEDFLSEPPCPLYSGWKSDAYHLYGILYGYLNQVCWGKTITLNLCRLRMPTEEEITGIFM